jgi:hypothetical protein
VAIPEIKLSYKIRYKIVGFDKEFETMDAYPEEEVESHKADIAGFEGVYGVYALPVHASDDDGEVIG